MWRNLHSLPGIVSLLLVAFIALSGVGLAFYPVRDGLSANVQSTAGLSVADAAAAISTDHPDIDRLTRTPAGSFKLSYFDSDGMPQEGYVDVRTGKILKPVAQGPSFFNTLKTFHRSLFLGERGRWVSAATGAILFVLSISGLFLLANRMGGWIRLFGRARGNWSARVHTLVSRLAVLPLMLSALSGVYMTLAEFSYIPVVNAESVTYPQSTQNLPAVSPGRLHALAETPLSSLRSLTFPIPGDPTDVFTVRTDAGILAVDQFTGDVLETVPYTLSERIYAWIYSMHTGVGMAWLGVILALASLTIPVIGLTGVVIWLKRTRGGNRRIKGNIPAAQADIVVLVGSETGTTWGFAASLHRDMTAAGYRVHVGPMNAYRPGYDKAKLVLFLAATHGNGGAPGNANGFLRLLAEQQQRPEWHYAVLGFGDRAFPQFCQFAKDVDLALENHGWQRLMPTGLINRQSTQAFTSWGNDLAEALGADFTLNHEIKLPPTRHLTLIEREVYGEEVQAPTAVLKFRYDEGVKSSLLDRMLGRDGKRPRFAPSDLLGILPPSGSAPRFYSVASVASDTEVEICVRKQVGGECSGFLHALPIGGTVESFVRTNEDFRMPSGKKPVVMVGAGTGIAPFMGMIRANRRHRDIHLFWGGRDPSSDFLYNETLHDCLEDGRLASLNTAFSRTENGAYVQDRVRAEGAGVLDLVRQGASIMVCGGDGMARAVMTEIDSILAPLDLSTTQLKVQGRYMEDVF